MILAKQKLRKNGNSIMLPDREGTENIRLRNDNTEGLQMNEYQTLTHSFAPVFDRNSEILILGTFPSVKSRENNFYYGHPQNRFWKVLAAIRACPVPQTTEEKKKFLLEQHIAIWDVIERCDIIGSSDSTIKNVTPADLSLILKQAPIRNIYGNGGKACELYQKYSRPLTGREIIRLPSTSPANAAWTLERLISAWSVVNES